MWTKRRSDANEPFLIFSPWCPSDRVQHRLARHCPFSSCYVEPTTVWKFKLEFTGRFTLKEVHLSQVLIIVIRCNFYQPFFFFPLTDFPSFKSWRTLYFSNIFTAPFQEAFPGQVTLWLVNFYADFWWLLSLLFLCHEKGWRNEWGW